MSNGFLAADSGNQLWLSYIEEKLINWVTSRITRNEVLCLKTEETSYQKVDGTSPTPKMSPLGRLCCSGHGQSSHHCQKVSLPHTCQVQPQSPFQKPQLIATHPNLYSGDPQTRNLGSRKHINIPHNSSVEHISVEIKVKKKIFC